MSYRHSTFKFLGIAGVVLLCMISCHSSPSAPIFPMPQPSGFIACAGHVFSFCNVAGADSDVAYAYWFEAPDSSRATLFVGIDASDTYSIYLAHDTTSPSGWVYVVNGSMDPQDWAQVTITNDSIIEGSHSIDCGQYFYLKKLQ
jgi:hypothetical protein